MSLLLLSSSEILTALICIGIAILISTIIVVVLRKRDNKKNTKKEASKPLGNNVTLNKTYCTKDEMKFLEALHIAIPREFIGLPHIGVDQIVCPKGDKVLYNKILSKYLDVCIFLKDEMTPILVIDLISSNPIQNNLKVMDQDVKDSLKFVKLPILQVKIEESYDVKALRKSIIEAIDVKNVVKVETHFDKI